MSQDTISSVAKASQTRRSRYYIVTITYNRRQFISLKCIDEMYRIVVMCLSKYGTEWSSFKGYELKRGVLHLHTICSCSRSPFIKQRKNWNIQLKEFPYEDYSNVVKYILKQDQHKCALEQREIESYYQTLQPSEIFIE